MEEGSGTQKHKNKARLRQKATAPINLKQKQNKKLGRSPWRTDLCQCFGIAEIYFFEFLICKDFYGNGRWAKGDFGYNIFFPFGIWLSIDDATMVVHCSIPQPKEP